MNKNEIIEKVEELESKLCEEYKNYTSSASTVGNSQKTICVVYDSSDDSLGVCALDNNSRVDSDAIKYLVEIECDYDEENTYIEDETGEEIKIDYEDILEEEFEKKWNDAIEELKYTLDISKDEYIIQDI